MSISTQTITTFFMNLLFAIGVILMIAGFVFGFKTLSYTLFLDEYPLEPYEQDCWQYSRPVMVDSPQLNQDATPPAQLSENPDPQCLSQITARRKVKQIENLTNSLGLFVAGIIVVLFFNPKKRS